MTEKEAAFNKISLLVERFAEQIDSYKKTDYNETLTRRDFIDPFFKALGWDIDNENGYAESYREVIHEDKLKIGSATKAPDYSFRLPGGKKLFFVEAKKPSVVVKDEIHPAYQIRRYGWSAKLPISIITDFEEFAIYDCTKKPNPTDKASVARIKYLTFRDYLSEFEFLWESFSKECVLKGSFDKFVKNDTNKKGTASVDKEFLFSLDSWRTILAQNISKNNKSLTEDEINFLVQQTLDRIIFLRIAEDRGVENYGAIKDCLTNGDFYQNIVKLFYQADQKYNSGLFDFKRDTISNTISIDNKVIKSIINELYYPDSPYEFSVLSVEILGSAYEQFLGKTIVIDKAHKVKIEEKPEVRKAGGVYYTPQYIVDYIVKNTVGKLVEGKTPEQVSDIKIVDPACGSGSFLLGAYQFLLDWHKSYYDSAGHGAYPGKGRKDDVLRPDGNLSTPEKKRILLNNIYGVDIDTNAVEVTKLSLLLKCLEGETEASISAQLRLFNERVLPTLDNNIKSGNSLVDTDFYENELDFGEEKKIKPFNWQKAFPDVFNRKKVVNKKDELRHIAVNVRKHAERAMEYAQELEEKLTSVLEPEINYTAQGGFDAVIGNPPWVDLKGHPQELVKYYFKCFSTTENRINLYSIFVEKGLSILSLHGILGYIVPNSILFQSTYQRLRKFILENHSVSSIVRLPDNVFQNVKAETLILTISKQNELTDCIIYNRKDIINQISLSNCFEHKVINSRDWIINDLSAFDIFSNNEEIELLKKIEQEKIPLLELCDFSLGLTPYDKYRGHSQKQIKERVFHSKIKRDDTFKPLLEGGDVKRYSVNWSQNEFISYGSWLGAPREQRFFTTPRILVRQIVSGKPLRIYAGYTELEYYNTQSVFNIITKNETLVNIKYLLGLVNSKLMNFYHSHKYLDLSKNLFQKILIQNCKKFPIKVIDTSNIVEMRLQNEIIKYVDVLIHLTENLQNSQLQSEQDLIRDKLEYYENLIDNHIYKLYGLSETEIGLIESATHAN
ncbi:MAG: N-6 DNA methylase [Ignavibacteriaceae bacterium]|nr:N-6 DNA methylase [Ignavibacteriaceae bacterium]